MAEKLTIKKWFDEEDGLPERLADDGTYLGTYDQGYDICEDGSTQVGWANDLDVAHLFAASPLMLEVLEEAFIYVDYHANSGSGLADRIKAAIAAAKGE